MSTEAERSSPPRPSSAAAPRGAGCLAGAALSLAALLSPAGRTHHNVLGLHIGAKRDGFLGSVPIPTCCRGARTWGYFMPLPRNPIAAVGPPALLQTKAAQTQAHTNQQTAPTHAPPPAATIAANAAAVAAW